MSLRVSPASRLRQRGRPGTSPCPVCGETRRTYGFSIHDMSLQRCANCNLLMLSQPLPESADGETANPAGKSGLPWTDEITERDAARGYLAALRSRGVAGGRMLFVTAGDHPVRSAIAESGGTIGSQVAIDDLLDPGWQRLQPGSCDAALVLFQIEQCAEPLEALTRIRGLLRPDGVVMLVMPTLDAPPVRWLGPKWTGWRPENRYYFDRMTIQSLLERAGFAQVWTEPDRRLYTLQHVRARAANTPGAAAHLAAAGLGWLPAPVRRRRVRLASSSLIVTAVRREPRERPLCSIIVPAFNEAATFADLMDALLAKQLLDMDKEVIIVESNSTDGTRDLARRYRDHPEVTLVLEDKPRGKGHAVRRGIEEARGDFVMIQDADLEYDLNDYDELLEPLVSHAVPFVLGRRHGNALKMRQFKDGTVLPTMLNVGHIVLTTLFNALYQERMQDPFTMYKVFRRDCLYGLEFECNRFDFDVELVSKLLRKGYSPLEVPVNYRARSFEEGKKVSMLRDPWTWVRAAIKYRRQPLPGPRTDR